MEAIPVARSANSAPAALPDTMTEAAVLPIPAAEIQPEKGLAFPDMNGKEVDQLPAEDTGMPKGGRGLLKVPSRSSSQQRNQSSVATTGLSGATVTDHRNSIGGRSKESRGSFAAHQRNGSASSKRTGRDSETGNTPGNTQPSSPSSSDQKKRKRRGGLLSLLGCCGVPDAANPVDEGSAENVHKVEKLPQRPVTATAKPRPQAPIDQQSVKQPDEKEAQRPLPLVDIDDSREASGSGQPQPVDANHQPKDASVTAPPAVTVEPPKPDVPEDAAPPHETEQVLDHVDQDVGMDDPPPSEQPPEAPIAAEAEEPPQVAIPPPPPGPGPAIVSPLPLTEPASAVQEPQKWLLPPIAPEHKGRKCLVLDLDETLVHSSFKVSTALFSPPHSTVGQS